MRALLIGLFAAVLCGVPLHGRAADDCPAWLPDLRCDRQARYEGFVAPMSAAFLFEDPFITTELSTWALWHDLPESGVFEGGDARALAAQVRVALTERLGLIATRDGRIDLRPDNDLLDTEHGYADVAFGFKYALVYRPDEGFILTPSLRYHMSRGTRDVLQGYGDGAWIPGVSAGLRLGAYHVLAGGGARLPVDGDAESTLLFYNLHADRRVGERLNPFVELNGYHYVDEGAGTNALKLGGGARLPVSSVQAALGLSGFEGMDVVHLGSDNVEGNDVVTLAVGCRFALTERASLGVAYERPLTRRRDILKQRVSFNLMVGF